MKRPAPAKHTATLPCAQVRYWVYNPSGTTVLVMVHGFRGDHHGLEAIAAKLPKTYKIIVPDLPGFGESSPLNCVHDIAGYTRFLKEFMDALKVKSPVVLGHSFGSIITAHFAADYPTLLGKLILVNPIATPALRGSRTVFTNLTIFYYWLGNKLPETAGRKLLGNKAIVLAMSALLAKTKDKTLRAHIHRSHLAHFSSFHSRQVVLESFRASVAHTATEKADRIRTPTLLIAGEVDDIAPLKGQQALQRAISNSQLVVIPRVGHLIHHEAPAQAARAIDDFITSVSA